MKMIVAIIQPEKLDAVKQSLFNADVYKMTVSRVRGCGQQGGYHESAGYNYSRIDRVFNEFFTGNCNSSRNQG